MNFIKKFLKEDDGLGTVEMVLLLAVLISIALIFRKQIITFVQNTLSGILGSAEEGATVVTGE